MNTLHTSPQGSQQPSTAHFYAMLSDIKAYGRRLTDTLSKHDPAYNVVITVTDWLPEGPDEASVSLERIREILETFLHEYENVTKPDEFDSDDDSSESDIEQHLLSEGDDIQRHTEITQSAAPANSNLVLSGNVAQAEKPDDAGQTVDGDTAIPSASSSTNERGRAATAPNSPVPTTSTVPTVTPAAAPPSAPATTASAPTTHTLSAPAPTPVVTATATSAIPPAPSTSTMRRQPLRRSAAFLEGCNPEVCSDYIDSENMRRAPKYASFEEELADYRARVLDAVKAVHGSDDDDTPGASSSSAPDTSTAGPSRAVSSTDNTSVASEPPSVKQESATPDATSPALGEQPQSTTGDSESRLGEPNPPESTLSAPSDQPRLDKGKKRARDDDDDDEHFKAETTPETSAYTFDPEVVVKRPTKRSRRTTTQVPPPVASRSTPTIPAGPSKFFSSENSSHSKKPKKQPSPADVPMPDTNGRPVVMIMSKHRSRSVDIPDEFSEVPAEEKSTGKRKRRQDKPNEDHPDPEPQPNTEQPDDAPSPPKKAKRKTRTPGAKSAAAFCGARNAPKPPTAAPAAAPQPQPEAGPSRSRSRPTATTRKGKPSKTIPATSTQPVSGPSRPRTTSKAPATRTSKAATASSQPAPRVPGPSRGRTATRTRPAPAEPTRRSRRLAKKDEVDEDVGDEVEVESQDI